MKTRILAISDTHGEEPDLPECDILIHAGDIASGVVNEPYDLIRAVKWLQRQPAKQRVLVPGNHDWHTQAWPTESVRIAEENGVQLLLGETVMIEGLNIYGAPWCPEFNGWAWNVPDLSRKRLWSAGLGEMRDIDILVTHTPPYGLGDLAYRECRYGDPFLESVLQQREQRGEATGLHVFGHIHEQGGSRGRRESGALWGNVAYLDRTLRPHGHRGMLWVATMWGNGRPRIEIEEDTT